MKDNTLLVNVKQNVENTVCIPCYNYTLLQYTTKYFMFQLNESICAEICLFPSLELKVRITYEKILC